MYFHRKLAFTAFAGLLAFSTAVHATPLAPFLDVTEQGLTLSDDGEGLVGWDRVTPATLNVTVGGTVRFALLYWAGRERPCTLDPSGTTCPVTTQDQVIKFNGVTITGTVIGTETQPASGGGPIFNVGYFADVTALVTAANTFEDGDTTDNLWRLDGVGLLVGYRDAANPTTYRVMVQDNLDFAYGADPTPGDTRVTSPVTFSHGATSAARTAELRLFMGDGEIERPDETTVSNNGSYFNLLDNSDGRQWNTDLLNINIPAGVSDTVVQMFSRPVNENPDSLLWEVAALRVALPGADTTPPTCPTTLNSGPPAVATTTFQDTGSGIASIVVNVSQNADTVVPSFTSGTNNPVVVTSTKIDQSQRARIEIKVTDVAGNMAICDPVHLIITANGDRPELKVNRDIPRAEDKVTIRNGKPGLANLNILVNGARFRVTGLKSGEERTIDISAAMIDGHNRVNFKGRGHKGSWAEVIIWEGPDSQ